jgi:hypothetical protein
LDASTAFAAFDACDPSTVRRRTTASCCSLGFIPRRLQACFLPRASPGRPRRRQLDSSYRSVAVPVRRNQPTDRNATTNVFQNKTSKDARTRLSTTTRIIHAPLDAHIAHWWDRDGPVRRRPTRQHRAQSMIGQGGPRDEASKGCCHTAGRARGITRHLATLAASPDSWLRSLHHQITTITKPTSVDPRRHRPVVRVADQHAVELQVLRGRVRL